MTDHKEARELALDAECTNESALALMNERTRWHKENEIRRVVAVLSPLLERAEAAEQRVTELEGLLRECKPLLGDLYSIQRAWHRREPKDGRTALLIHRIAAATKEQPRV